MRHRALKKIFTDAYRDGKEEFSLFLEFLRKNRWLLLFSTLLLFLVYGSWIFDADIYLDSEIYYMEPGSTYNWLTTGRQGDALTQYLFGLKWFNPLFSRIFGFVLLGAAGIFLDYLLYRASGRGGFFVCIAGLLYFSYPVFVELFYFSAVLFEIAWAFCMWTLAVGLCWLGILRKNNLIKLPAILMMIWCFSSYQIFIVLHAALIAVMFLLVCYRWGICGTRKVSGKEYWAVLGHHIAIFLAALLINEGITRAFFYSSDYLTSQISWNGLQSLRVISAHIINGFFGKGEFYTPAFGLCAALVFFVLLYQCLRLRQPAGGIDKTGRLLYLIAGIFFQITPFLLTIYMAKVMPARTQLAYPLVIAGDIVFLATVFWGKKAGRYVCLAGTLILFWVQSNTTVRLLYTDHIRKEEDLRLATEIEQRIAQVSPEQPLPPPIAFVGCYTPNLNLNCLCGELIGTSIFEMDGSYEPHYLYSTQRAVNMMNTMGFPFQAADAEQITAARAYAIDMPCWPAEGSVTLYGDIIVVKLSEDNWVEDFDSFIQDKLYLEEVNLPENLESDKSLEYCVDGLEENENYIRIPGWLVRQGDSSRTSVCSGILRNKKTGKSYEAYTSKTIRSDLKSYFQYGQLYSEAGFTVLIPPDKLPGELADYELILEYQDVSGQTTFVVAGDLEDML